jgi:hypothetical protein
MCVDHLLRWISKKHLHVREVNVILAYWGSSEILCTSAASVVVGYLQAHDPKSPFGLPPIISSHVDSLSISSRHQ